MIVRATCLSINRGLYVSYSSSIARNLRASVHVFHQGKPLHLIPHIRLGSGRQSSQFCVYAFLPEIAHPQRTTSLLTREERQRWIDHVLLVAIRHMCPSDIVQYHLRLYADVESKSYGRWWENCSGRVHHNMDMHHFIPHCYLKRIWRHMRRITAQPDLAMFRGIFLVLSAKNIKLEDWVSTF